MCGNAVRQICPRAHTETHTQLFSAQYLNSKKKSWAFKKNNRICCASSHPTLAILWISCVFSKISRIAKCWINKAVFFSGFSDETVFLMKVEEQKKKKASLVSYAPYFLAKYFLMTLLFNEHCRGPFSVYQEVNHKAINIRQKDEKISFSPD